MIEVSKSLIERNGKYLLLRRSSSSKFFPNLWDFPGGKTNPAEDTREALIRETKEETSLEITPDKKIGDFNYTENDVPIHFQIFSINNFVGDVKLSQDHSAFTWIPKKDLDKYDLAPIVKLFFNLS